MTEKTRWGILATGNIARKFATGLTALDDAEILAVGSRTLESADRFGDQFNIPRRYAGYETLVADPDVDAIYIGTPHTFHKENALLCLHHGKAVLCEKPFTINAAEACEVIAAARAHNVFLMEAMWTRYLPLVAEMKRLVDDGVIGDVRMVTADFGYRADFNPASRIFDPALGGGALLDVGIYPLSLASMLLGTPEATTGLAELGATGVDEQAGMVLRYAGGRLAVLHTAVRTSTPHEALIMGSDGWIRIHSPWWVPTTMTISKPGQEPQTVEIPFVGNGYNYEAAEVQKCLRRGQTESALMPLDETLSLMETMDTLRAQWGMRYPGEAKQD